MTKSKHLKKTLKNQNRVYEETTTTINARNACYFTFQNLLFSLVFYKNVKF
jgi:hypothetical protein